MTYLVDYIKMYPNVLREEQCKIITERFRHSPQWKKDNYRDCDVIDLADKLAVAAHRDIDEMLYRAVTTASRLYMADYPNVKIRRDLGYDILRHNQNAQACRDLAFENADPAVLYCSIILNEEYSGGDTMFSDGQTNINMPLGSALIFPSSFVFAHSVGPVRKGQRISAVTWLL